MHGGRRVGAERVLADAGGTFIGTAVAVAAAVLVLSGTSHAATWRGREAPDPRAARVVASEFVARHAAALGLNPAESISPLAERLSPSGRHVRLERRVGGLVVRGGDVVVHLGPDASVDYARARDLPTVVPPAVPLIAAADAERVALGASGLGDDAFITRVELVLTSDGLALRPAWEVWVFGDTPVSRWRVVVDAESGAVRRANEMVRRLEGTGLAFVPSPVVALSDNTLTDQDDADTAVPAQAYSTVALRDLDPVTDGVFRLRGRYARAVDLESPFIAPPAEATATFAYTRANDDFEWVMTYVHTDGLARFYAGLGFADVNDRAIEFDAHGFNGSRGAHYVADGNGTGYIAFGDGGVDSAEDGELILHELGHATQDDQCPNCFFEAEAAAMGEGFADFLAAAYFLDASSGFQDACFGDWYATSGTATIPACLRRIDGTKRYPDDLGGGQHAEGEIWSALLWDLLLGLAASVEPTSAARDIAVTLALESHFLLPSDPSFWEGAQALLDADELLYAGAHHELITAKLAARGLLPPPQIFGGGRVLTDCAGVFLYANPNNPAGARSRKQECRDGDPTCDSDAIPGQCTFRTSFCFAQRGSSRCAPAPVERFEMRSPLPDQDDLIEAAIADALTGALTAIPGATRGGDHDEIVSWTPRLDAPACSPPADLVIPLRRSGGGYRKTTVPLRTVVVLPRNFTDTDRLRLSCVPN